MNQAEQMLIAGRDPRRVEELAIRAVRDDEWRLQRIRPFDWYNGEFKRRSQEELQAEYWRLWSIQVRCYRKANRLQQADQLLHTMEERARLLGNDSATAYWDAEASLARLAIEVNQKALATQKLTAMSQFLGKHPDPSRSAQLEQLRKLISQSE
jgi:hypothetical protein